VDDIWATKGEGVG